jgi:hypothetical protein
MGVETEGFEARTGGPKKDKTHRESPRAVPNETKRIILPLFLSRVFSKKEHTYTIFIQTHADRV